ncbi:hypothetical protein CERSUDRAFT_108226 [Gelatoporia subvermispora B]|uniref:DUF1793-domain-containing protein n=1 Tax=Ceriporiopsis subvermispora (strain B) TaxID=914234 RepID=M2R3K4_CERS8|nr:hypothetical protein CERSUDRAFT_108226 [Gelatoporia subvermispora B]
MLPLLCQVVLLSLLGLVLSQSPSGSHLVWPEVVPVAVRSPYFSCWMLTGTQDGAASTQWPQFWSYVNGGDAILGWAGLVRVDNATYQWLGLGFTPANLTDIKLTPTRTIFEMQAGPVNLTITYMMPIEPSDWVQQSLPFSYVSLEVASTDGLPHDVEAYADISGEWLSGNRSSEIQWTTVVGNDIVYHEVSLASPVPFQEIDHQANDGVMYHAISQGPNVTWQTGAGAVCRGQFNSTGNLTNGMDMDFRPLDGDFPVFAFAVSLGSIKSTAVPVVWSLGYVRNPAIQYLTPSGDTQLRSPFFLTQYSSVVDAMTTFVTNYPTASQRASEFDQSLTQAATNISSQYAGILSLAPRIAFGGLDITVSDGTDGQLNASDVKTFMKDMGNSRRVNPVEVLYQAFPMYLYLNASFARSLLSPLLEYQDSASYRNPYAAMDLGFNYSAVAGDNLTHNQGIEQTGNMLIMTLAHARISGDGSLISEHYGLLKAWADYLINNTLTPTINQQSADHEAIANSTNLSVKGIIAIGAMAELSRAVGDADSLKLYSRQASAFIKTWQSLALSSDQQHLLLDYGDSDATWSLAYNLYADRLLGLNLVDPSTYQKQTAFYQSVATSHEFGPPLDSNHTGVTNAAWLLFASATASNETLAETLTTAVWEHVFHLANGGILPISYNTAQGQILSGSASPGNGAMFAPLALGIHNTTISVPAQLLGTNSSTSVGTHESGTISKRVNVGAIIGGAIGGIYALGLLATALLIWQRKSRQSWHLVGVPFKHGTSLLRSLLHPPQSLSEPQSDSKGTIAEISAPPLDPLDPQEPPSRSSLAGRNPESVHFASSEPTASSSRSPSNDSHGSRTSGSGLDSSTYVRELRDEVENLRRVMQELQIDRLAPPPEYVLAAQDSVA